MGNAALLMREAGHEVLGSDKGIYPPMSDVLTAAGVTIHEGYDPVRLAQLAPDLVVIGNAQTRGNPEVEWLLDTRALPYTSLPALLSEHILATRQPVVIAGTHGKTTTSALAAHLLSEVGANPGWLIGGATRTPKSGFRVGQPGAPFVIEGDEYDSAFFDKRSKFIHYRPRIAAINAVELDHIDIFLSLEDYLRTFRHFTRILPRSGFLVVNGDDPHAVAIADAATWTNRIRVGTGDGCDVQLRNFREEPGAARFELLWHGKPWCEVAWQLYGVFNARNAAIALTCSALSLHPADPTCFRADALASFLGVRRRQEHRLETDRLLVIEDFGHHPTAIRETLAALRSRHPGRKLWACFEPRSNSSRTETFREGFEGALSAADRVWIGAVPVKEGGGDNLISTARMAENLARRGTPASAPRTNPDLLHELRRESAISNEPLLVVFFSNGSFDGIIDAFSGSHTPQ